MKRLLLALLITSPAAGATLTDCPPASDPAQPTWGTGETLLGSSLAACVDDIEAAITAAEAAAQPLDSDLTAVAALTTTAYGRGLLDDADAAASRTSIGAAATSHSHAASDVTSGTLALARGGLAADVSAYTNGLYCALSSATDDCDTIAELETALGGEDIINATELNAAGGRSITCAAKSCDADAELYTVEYHFPFLASSVVATNDITWGEVGSTFTPTRWVCLAQGGSGLTTIDASIEECNTSGAACAGIGATSTVTAVDTPVADTSFTDTTLTAGNWLRFVFGTITWTTPGTFSCTLRGTRND